MKHIVMVPSWYPNNDADLSGVFFRDQGIALQKAGYKVTVAYVETRSAAKIAGDLRSRSWKPGFYINQAQLTEYRCRIYNLLLKFPGGKEWLVYRKLKRHIRRIEKTEGPIDLIHLHSFRSHGYGTARICRRKKIPYVLTEHYSGIENRSLKPYQNRIIRLIGRTASALIAVGDGGASYLKELTGREVSVIPNMVDVSGFNPSDYPAPGGRRIFSLGYLKYRKGFDLLINAFYSIHSEYPDVELLIGGEGAERENLESLIESLEHKDPSFRGKTRLYGAVSRQELPRLMAECSLFSLASRDEAFGVVFIEALAMGKPLVATSNAGPRRIVNRHCGILVNNEDSEDLAKGLKHVLDHPESYDPSAIRSYCIDNYSEEAVVRSLQAVYNSVIN
ncbi:MAG: glycosyltransferase [Spirochaetales bacterium]|nr:glycosyltransferase [Spirochaetales bacterium]